HIPTLSLVNLDRAANGLEPVPLITKNSTTFLAYLAGTRFNPEQGIIFGKVPAGYELSLSSLSATPIFFNEEYQTVAAQDLEKDRFFVYLGVEPGSHLLYMTGEKNLEEVAAIG